MWDDHVQLDRIATGLYTLAGLAAAYGVVLYVLHLPIFPLRQVEVTGAPERVTYAQVTEIVRTEFRGNFFTLDLPGVRAAFEKLPWVRAVQVRRHWPDRLQISLEEHVPLARWGNEALVNLHGEVFRAAYDGELPVFVGPPGTEKEIAIQYEFFRRALEPIRETPVMVQVSPRWAWEVRLAAGTTLALGREQVEARIARYVAAHQRTIEPLRRRIDYVDLRYSNGFAVRIAELKDAAPGTRPQQGAREGRGARQGARPGSADNRT
jgi:cell division protein FtsQ